jgi:hypothetical protein
VSQLHDNGASKIAAHTACATADDDVSPRSSCANAYFDVEANQEFETEKQEKF